MRTMAEAEREARSIVNKWAVIAVPTGMIPGSPLLLPGLDAKLISDIAKCFEVTNYTVDAVIGVVGASVAGRTAASIVLTMIPVAGWIANGFVAGGTTKVAGQVMVDYFKERSKLR